MKKRWISLVMMLVLVTALIPVFTTNAEAAGNPYPYWQTLTDKEDGVTTTTRPCTYYVWQLVNERFGIELPMWDHAGGWLAKAAAQGYFATGSKPMPNSIAVYSGGDYGHVALVTSVNGDEMTVDEAGRTDHDSNGTLKFTDGIAGGQPSRAVVNQSRGHGFTSTLIGFIYLDTALPEIVEDTVRCSHPDENHNATITFQAKDDFALTAARAVVWKYGETEEQGKPFPLELGIYRHNAEATATIDVHLDEVGVTDDEGIFYWKVYLNDGLHEQVFTPDDKANATQYFTLFEIMPDEEAVGYYRVISDAPVRIAPYEKLNGKDTKIKTKKTGKAVQIVGRYVNKLYNHEWYQLEDGGWIYSEHLKKYTTWMQVEDIANFKIKKAIRWVNKQIVAIDNAYVEVAQKSAAFHMVAGDRHIPQPWEGAVPDPADTSRIYFNANGGECEKDSLAYAVGEEYAAFPTPSRFGHTFLGWFTAPEGGTQVSEQDICSASVKTLYAHWERSVLSEGIFCGDLNYVLYSNGVLVISGTGPIEDHAWAKSSLRQNYTFNYLVLEEGVTGIGTDAFYGCSSLRGVTIPESVTSIGENAFYNCDSLVSVIMPETGVVSIGSSAFYDCDSLRRIVIPDSVTSIGSVAFSACDSLMEINVDENNTKYCSDQGVLLDKTGKSLICCPGRKTGDYTIPDSVQTIFQYAFQYCRHLTSVTIPDGINSIEWGAFQGCTDLTRVTLPKNAPICLSMNDLFNGCSSLETVTIPYGVTEIGNDVFRNCSKLKSVTIPETVKDIGESAFSGCKALEDVYFTGSAKRWNAIRISENNTCLTGANIHLKPLNPGIVDTGSCGENVTWELGENGTVTIQGTGPMADYTWNNKSPFYGDSAIHEVIIGDGVTGIGNYAFQGCDSLTHVTIPESVVSIGDSAFYSCDSLQDLTIPNSVTSIGPGAFSYSGLVSVTVPKGVATIEEDAFRACKKLAAITIPDTVTSVESAAFDMCYSLRDVYYTGSSAQWDRIAIDDSYNYALTAAVLHCADAVSTLQITTQPKNYVGKLNSTASFSVAAEGEGLTYQWQISDDNGATWTNSSVKRAAYTSKLTAEKNGRQVRCVVTDEAGNSLTSDAAVMKLSGPAITTQPKDYTGKLNSTAAFTVAAVGEGLTYQWQVSDDNGKTWSNSSVKTAKYSTKLTAARDGRQVRCIVTDAEGSKATSNVATMTLQSTGVTITTQPKDYVGKVNSTASFTVVAEGNGLTYQWQVSDDNGATWTNSSVKKAVYTTKLTDAKNGRQVRCIVTDANGKQATSAAATMRLAGPVITSQPKNYVGKVNSTASFTVVAEGNGLSYQWQISDNDGDSWTNSSVKKAVYTSKLTTAKDGRMVRCVVTDADGKSVTSNDVTMRIG